MALFLKSFLYKNRQQNKLDPWVLNLLTPTLDDKGANFKAPNMMSSKPHEGNACAILF